MLKFLLDNLGTIIISAVLVAVVTVIVVRLVKNKKQGKTSCGCGCEHCENSKYCHKENSK